MEDRKHGPLVGLHVGKPCKDGGGDLPEHFHIRDENESWIGLAFSKYHAETLSRSVNLSDKYEALERAAEWFMRHHAEECNCNGDTVDCVGPVDSMRYALSSLQEAKKSLPKEP